MSCKTAAKVARLCPQGWSSACKTLTGETEAGRCPEHMVGKKSAPIQAGQGMKRIPLWTQISCLDDKVWESRILADRRGDSWSKLKTSGQIPRKGNRGGVELFCAAPGAEETGPVAPTHCCCCCLVTHSCLTLYNPWTAAHQAPLSFTISQRMLRFIPIESVMPSNHLNSQHTEGYLFSTWNMLLRQIMI